ncbi:hypothetical protein BX666DRAFT_643290 [Dichotomocladium elegans]|nr:hypothetical protein BX666DRAFT_643290 [Dichotomocladium elegans]
MNLVRVAILLTHYSCAAVSEESAYMTLRVGMGYAIRCSLPTIGKSMTGARGNRSAKSTVAGVDAAERKRGRILFKVLNAWNTWLSFYLHRDDWIAEDGALQSEAGISCNSSTGISPSALRKMMDDKNSSDQHARQRWAVHATDAYTDFLRQVSRVPHDLLHLQETSHILASTASTSVFLYITVGAISR